MRLLILTALLTAIYVPTWGNSAVAQGIQTYERRFIWNIGYAEVDRRGNKIVVINPAVCQRLGPDLCSFFRAHEMAHHQLKHFDRNIPVQQKEAEADRHAASVVSPAAARQLSSFCFRTRWKSDSRLQSTTDARVSSPKRSSQTSQSSPTKQVSPTKQLTQTKQLAQAKQSSQTSAATTTKTPTTSGKEATTSDRLNATRSVRQPQPRPTKYCKCP